MLLITDAGLVEALKRMIPICDSYLFVNQYVTARLLLPTLSCRTAVIERAVVCCAVAQIHHRFEYGLVSHAFCSAIRVMLKARVNPLSLPFLCCLLTCVLCHLLCVRRSTFCWWHNWRVRRISALSLCFARGSTFNPHCIPWYCACFDCSFGHFSLDLHLYMQERLHRLCLKCGGASGGALINVIHQSVMHEG
jgi:hypothetical protein